MTARSAPSEAAEAGRGDVPPSMVERLTLILDAFEGPATRLSLEDVARCTLLPRSTAHRILDQLVRTRWLEHTESGYRLGRRALVLGGRDGGHGEIRATAAPLLHEIQINTGMVVHLAVPDGAEVYYLDKLGGRGAMAVPSRVGGSAPAHSTGLGKAMLAWDEPEQVDLRVGPVMSRSTRRTIGELSTLHRELDRIRQRRGLAFEWGECFPGIACVAAAIRGPEGPVAGVSVVGDPRTALEKVAPLVTDAAKRISLALFPGRRPSAGSPRGATRPDRGTRNLEHLSGS